jgi:hypothetical protein
MKKLLLLTFAACLTFSMALAQPPDPANFHVYYGNVDGSAISVGIDRDIDITVWMQTDPTPGNPDSVTSAHMPLASDNLIIPARNGGDFFLVPHSPLGSPKTRFGNWDDVSFLGLNLDNPIPGWTNQSIFGLAFLFDPRSPENFIYNLGVPEFAATFFMHTANDPSLIGQTICPFREGNNPQNHLTYWGMQDGVRQVVPTQHYGCLFFSPNQEPVLVEPAGGAVTIPNGGCFNVVATDVDVENDLHISLEPGDLGTFTETLGGPGGVATGQWCGNVPSGTVVTFLLNDGNVVIPADVVITVDCYEITEANLAMTCPDGAPGAIAEVYVTLESNGCVGGFEILIQTDPTALNLTTVDPLFAIHFGSEYFNHVPDPFGPGTDRFVWVANINNGVDGPPMGWTIGAEPILKLTYGITPGLPWGMNIPVTFMITDYTDNTISDETGYNFFHPTLDDGCVNTANPEEFVGDPNMNCRLYEIADAVLVARRLIEGFGVWAEDDGFGMSPDCDTDTHYLGNDPMQEAGADLNGNGIADIADLVRFINIINGFIMPPKLDPTSGIAFVSIGDGTARISSGVEVGGLLVRIDHAGEIGAPVASNGMEILSQDVDGVLSVLVYSLAGNRVPAGNSVLFTVPGEGEMTISEVSAADAYGRLLDVTARQDAPLPTVFTVNPNYPNPFNAKTLINFAMPQAGQVTVNIYSVTGQLVETLGGQFDAGYQSIEWDASNVSSGIYFAKVASGSDSQTVKMTLLK